MEKADIHICKNYYPAWQQRCREGQNIVSKFSYGTIFGEHPRYSRGELPCKCPKEASGALTRRHADADSERYLYNNRMT